MFSSVVQGESRLFTVLGTNATLGGVKLALEKTHRGLESLLPCANDIIVITQVAIGVATLIYMVLKIRKILTKKPKAKHPNPRR